MIVHDMGGNKHTVRAASESWGIDFSHDSGTTLHLFVWVLMGLGAVREISSFGGRV